MDPHKLDPKSSFYSQTLQVILRERVPISPDTYMFTFSFNHPEDNLGQLITQHLIIYGENLKGEVVTRKYTAISPIEQQGSFDILIKIYRPNVNPLFPEGGELTPWLERLNIGSKVTIKRCIGKLLYLGMGECIIKPKENKEKTVSTFKTILMTCGGTGITPAYQLIQSILNDPDDKTKIFLMFANRTESDILLRNLLEEFHMKHADRFTIIYVVDKGDENWKGFVGYVTEEMMKKSFPTPDDSTLATLCGPKPMNKLVSQFYKEFGVNEKHILKF